MTHGRIVGIDLGTTNSAVAALIDGEPQLLPIGQSLLLPSIVSYTPSGEMLVGASAKNQYHLYPERSVRSVKRHMGSQTTFSLGDQTLNPVEVSALILRTLKHAAEQALGESVTRAVITVPAYFSDAQRTATKEAGEIAGLHVERIINEPTAAALCYESDDNAARTVVVYDLGGGTFDVSVVRIRGEVTEVLASHGNTSLGGDDFDAALLARLRHAFQEQTGVSLDNNTPHALARLQMAAEAAKIRLSSEHTTEITEESLVVHKKVPQHLRHTITRDEYESLIQALLNQTLDSVDTALREAQIRIEDIDSLILVGGSSRTPRVHAMLESKLNLTPRVDFNPDQVVALGAALLAARIEGLVDSRVLVDVTPFSFGTAVFGFLHGVQSSNCYAPVIRRNTPLPTKKESDFETLFDGQEAIDVRIYQGEHSDVRNNILLGRFMVEGLDEDAPAGSAIRFSLKLDLNGILDVTVTETHTGLNKHVEIKDAFRKLDPSNLASARDHIQSLINTEHSPLTATPTPEPEAPIYAPPSKPPHADTWDDDQNALWTTLEASSIKASHALQTLTDDADREELKDTLDDVASAMSASDFDTMRRLKRELDDILFYLR